MQEINFKIEGMLLRYNFFVPKLYNLCKKLGFEKGKIIPSRAFCSDENQGYPIILITKHFGAFPFNHGMVGGIIATDRHGPHAHHGQDCVIIHASHIGYDPEEKKFGEYRRLQIKHPEETPTCGKILGTIAKYNQEYNFAQKRIFLQKEGDNCMISIDNLFLDEKREEGLFLDFDNILEKDEDGEYIMLKIFSTSNVFKASKRFVEKLENYKWKEGKGEAIGKNLSAELFYFKRKIEDISEGKAHLESNLLKFMPQIVTSVFPGLTAAMVNSQQEFNRAYRTIANEKEYKGKKVLFISGVNIDISPMEGQIFPLTKFLPWAAYFQDSSGKSKILEQTEIVKELAAESAENIEQINLEEAIGIAEKHKEIEIKDVR